MKRYENGKSGAGKRKVPSPVVSRVQLLQPLEWTIVYHEGIVCGKRKETDVLVDKQGEIVCLGRGCLRDGYVVVVVVVWCGGWWWRLKVPGGRLLVMSVSRTKRKGCVGRAGNLGGWRALSFMLSVRCGVFDNRCSISGSVSQGLGGVGGGDWLELD